MIVNILVSASASYCMASIGLVGFFPSLIVILLLSSSGYAFRIVYPPFESASSFLSLAQDSSLVAPYNIQDEGDKERINDNNSGSGTRADVVHFCFLVHGYKGFSTDLSYFETVLKHRVSFERNRLGQDQYETDDDFIIVPTSAENRDGKIDNPPRIQDMVVHNAVCNGGKTNDGIVNGGDRLVEEIMKTVDSSMKERYIELENMKNKPKELYDITISIIGNSMGGVYGRYAIAKLIERHCVAKISPTTHDRKTWILDDKYRLCLDTFCTTAAPHLGVSQHTWIRIPRMAELGVAATMGQTGSDLFRLNDLLYTMSTNKSFLDPLASFRKRIAYANCYGTDFPVPTGTAAFLSDKSTYPHQFVKNFKVENECGLVTATLMTEPNLDAEYENEEEEPLDEIHEMSVSLDRLGWKKVFVDLQKEMLSISLPRLGCGVESSSSSSSSSSSENDLRDLKKLHNEVVSKDIVNAVANSCEKDTNERVTLRAPTGHNMIVAFSRDRLSTFLNKGGRPLVDALAKELIQDIFLRNRKVEEESIS